MASLYNYYLYKSPQAAVRIYNRIIDEAERLISHPHIGSIEPYLANLELPYRSLVVTGGIFKIVYVIDNDRIVIYRIWSCRQNPKNISN